MTHTEIDALPAGRELDALVDRLIFGVEPTGKARSTDIGAAWEVVEAMHDRGYEVILRPWCWGGDWHQAQIDGSDRGGIAKAETLPLAICHAAVQAVAP